MKSNPSNQIAGFTSNVPEYVARVRSLTLLALALLLLALPGMTLADSPLQEDAPGQVALGLPIYQGARVVVLPKDNGSYCRRNTEGFVVKLMNVGMERADRQTVIMQFQVRRNLSDPQAWSNPQVKESRRIPSGATRKVVFDIPSVPAGDWSFIIYHGSQRIIGTCIS